MINLIIDAEGRLDMFKIILLLLASILTLVISFILEQKRSALTIFTTVSTIIFSIMNFFVCLLSIPAYPVTYMCSFAGISILSSTIACILTIRMLYHFMRKISHPEYISVKELDTILINMGVSPISSGAKRKYRKQKRQTRQKRPLLRDTITMTHFIPSEEDIEQLASKYHYTSINDMPENEIVDVLEWIRTQCIKLNPDLNWECPTIYQQNLIYFDFSSTIEKIFTKTEEAEEQAGEESV